MNDPDILFSFFLLIFGRRGKLRGENTIFKFRMDGIDVCHLGDLGEECSSALIEAVLPVNVLLIPVGGNYTIDADMAKEYVDRIMPEIVIPMHYRTKDCKLDIDKVDVVLLRFWRSSAVRLLDRRRISGGYAEYFLDNAGFFTVSRAVFIFFKFGCRQLRDGSRAVY